MNKALVILVLIASEILGSEPSQIKMNGFVLNIGGANGPGIGYSANYNSRFQIHTLVGYFKAQNTVGITVDPGNQPQNIEVTVSGLSALLGARYYPIENLYFGTGIIHRIDRAEFVFDNPNTGKKEIGKGKAPTLAIPVNIGGEIARCSILSGYAEFSNKFTLTNRKPGSKVSSENLALQFFNDIYEWKIGIGVSINWGSLNR